MSDQVTQPYHVLLNKTCHQDQAITIFNMSPVFFSSVFSFPPKLT
eukprot:UN27575